MSLDATAATGDTARECASGERTAASLQARLVDALDLEAFPKRGYRRAEYLGAALDAGFEPAELAVAHDVSTRTISRAIAAHDEVEWTQPPSSGPAKTLWDMDPDAVPEGSE